MFNQKNLVLGLMLVLAVCGVTQVARADNDNNSGKSGFSGKEEVKGGLFKLFYRGDDRDDKRGDDKRNDDKRFSGVVGTISAINGSSLTVQSKGRMMMGNNNTPSATTYTVNVATATIFKNNATSSLSALVVGDMVLIEGMVNGTSVTATSIHASPFRPDNKDWNKDKVPFIQGNGQPVIGGTVTAVSTSTLTVNNKSGLTYTVNSANAIVYKNNATSTFSNIVVNDTVIVQGAVNGNAVTASIIVDQGINSGANNNGDKPKVMGGLFRAFGGFFSHLFGF